MRYYLLTFARIDRNAEVDFWSFVHKGSIAAQIQSMWKNRPYRYHLLNVLEISEEEYHLLEPYQ